MDIPKIVTNGGEGLAYTAIIKCEKGHEQRMRFLGHPRKYVELWAALIDGTAYPVRPGPDSMLGYCGICRTQLRSEIIDEPPAP
jgi:hypothetical protein